MCICVLLWGFYVTIFIIKSKDGDPKAPFSIATTPRCRGRHYSSQSNSFLISHLYRQILISCTIPNQSLLLYFFFPSSLFAYHVIHYFIYFNTLRSLAIFHFPFFYFYYYVTPCKFFTSGLVDGLRLENV